MKYFLIALTAIILQVAPAYADPICSPKVTQAAIEQIRALNRQLLQFHQDSENDGTITPEAKLPMGLLNEALKQWMTAELNCQPSEKFDLVQFNAHIQETIKPILSEKLPPNDHETHYGLNWIKLKFDQQRQFLFVKTSQDMPCTDDMILMGYRANKDQEDAWTKVLDISTDYSAEKPGAYRFKEPAFIKDPKNGHTNILVSSIPGQCNSMWYSFKFMVIDPALDGRPQQNLFILRDGYYNGDLSDDGGPELEIKGNRFHLSWYTPDFADHLPGEPRQPQTTIRTYELNNRTIKPVKTLK